MIEVPPLREADATAFTVAPEPVVASSEVPAGAAASNAADPIEDDDANPTVVRQQIAAARRNMDPDHQIRRAMDAFLSPTKPNGDPHN